MEQLQDPYAALAPHLAGTRFSRIRYLARTESTNRDASALLGEPGSGGLTIVAGFQHAGAGRKGRAWIAPPGSALLFTTILPEPLPSTALWLVPFWSACVVWGALAELGVNTCAQWPNDLLLGDRKLAGMLAVSRVAGDRAFVGCGIGINLRRYPNAEREVSPPPAFCDDIRPLEAPQLLAAILRSADAMLDAFERPAALLRRWERIAEIPGKRYRLLPEGESEPFEARALALETGGALRVERSDGSIVVVGLGDVRALR